MHTDSLLPQAAALCSHADSSVRKAVLSFLLSCAGALPFARMYPWRDAILAGIALTLDDPRRETRRLSVLCSNKYYNLE